MKKYLDTLLATAQSKGFVPRNLLPKLASILLAVILWAYISSTKSSDLKFKIPVSFRNLENNLIISKISRNSVIVRVHGKTEELKNTQAKNIRVFVDFQNAEPGKYREYRLDYTRNEIPEGIDIDLSPREINVLVEKKETKSVRIVPKYSGNVAQGYLIGKIKVVPDRVMVTGPESQLKELEYIPTREISIDDKSDSLRETVALETAGTGKLNYSLSRVKVVIPVISYSQIKIAELPVILKNKARGYSYSVESDSVKAHIMISDGRSADERGYSAYVDLSRISIGKKDFADSGTVSKKADVIVRGKNDSDSDDVISVTPSSVIVLIEKD